MPHTDLVTALSQPLEPIPTDATPDLRPLPGIRALLFDIYGTLIISGSGDVGTAKAQQNAEALVAALTAVGMEGELESAGPRGIALLMAAVEACHREKRAFGATSPEVEIRELWRLVLHALRTEELIQGNLDHTGIEQLALEYELRVNPTWPMPNAGEVIEGLKATDLILGIVSNAQFYTPILMETYLGAEPKALGFRYCSWSWVLGESKPSEVLFTGILKELHAHHGLRPEQIAYVGNDMLNDVWTAHESGCRTILFAGDRRSLRLREDHECCQGLTPDRTLTNLNQLTSILIP
ncbi:MAG: HAD family hydrolase [Planctomycetota bacterium]|jgi:putative hydrolase of the HAD superfamily